MNWIEHAIIWVPAISAGAWVWWYLRPRPPAAPKIPEFKAPPLTEPACPDCGSERFFRGPCGGMSVNLKCVGCGHFWNWMGPLGFEHIDSKDQYFDHGRAYRLFEL
jgi:hypothetical protein